MKTPAAGTDDRKTFDLLQSQRLDRIIDTIDAIRELPDGDAKDEALQRYADIKRQAENAAR